MASILSTTISHVDDPVCTKDFHQDTSTTLSADCSQTQTSTEQDSCSAVTPTAPYTAAIPSYASAATAASTAPSEEHNGFANKYSIRSTAGKDLRDLNVFHADRAIKQVIGPYVRYDLGSSKTLTVTVSSASQGQRLMKMEMLLSEPVKVDVHPSCRQSVGIANCALLNRMPEADILEGLNSQKVTKVVRVNRDSATYRFTFSTPSLPATLTLGTGHTVSVRKAYPLPLRCFTCQQYGHSHSSCKSKKHICVRCGQAADESHDVKSCNRPEHCFHCKEPHAASSPQCQKYATEKAILLLHHRDGVSLPDARRRVMSARMTTSQQQSQPTTATHYEQPQPKMSSDQLTSDSQPARAPMTVNVSASVETPTSRKRLQSLRSEDTEEAVNRSDGVSAALDSIQSAYADVCSQSSQAKKKKIQHESTGDLQQNNRFDVLRDECSTEGAYGKVKKPTISDQPPTSSRQQAGRDRRSHSTGEKAEAHPNSSRTAAPRTSKSKHKTAHIPVIHSKWSSSRPPQ